MALGEAPAPQARFLADGGEMGERIRQFDWAATPLGPVEAWPGILRTAIGLLLTSKQPNFIGWGPALISIYNDGYIPILGTKHPWALGRPMAEAWSEIWRELKPISERALAGEAQWYQDMPFPMTWRGEAATSYFSFSYMGLRDEAGTVRGIFCSGLETTARVLAERNAHFIAALSDTLRGEQDASRITTRAAQMLGEHLGAGGCGYCDMEPDEEHFTVVRDWTAGVLPGLVGHHRMSAFGPQVAADYRAGRVVRIVDARTDPRTRAPEVASVFAAKRIVGALGVPLVKHGRVVGVLYVHAPEPRAWTESEIELVREVAERTWAAMERARAEQRLRELNETLEARVAERTAERDRLWRNSRDMQVVMEPNGILRAVNPAFTRILGWPAERVVGRQTADFVMPQEREAARAALEQAVRAGLPGFEGRYRHADGGYRWISWVAAPQEDLIYASGRDVTAEREQAEALAKAEEALRHAQKMEAVGQLTGGVAHDFNNLLTGIIGSLDLLQTRLAAGRTAGLDRYIEAAQSAARRAASLTQRLLAFSRRQTLDPKPIDIGRLATGMAELIGRSVGPGIAVEVPETDGIWTTLVDPSQLENALLNLCINARDAMPDGGRLAIATANRQLDAAQAGQVDVAPGGYVVLSVTDTGTGMAPDVIARAFEPFFTTKPLGAGTGLGLSMAYGFARQSGGQVRIESELGRGTTVSLYLPRYEGDAAKGSAAEAEQEGARAAAGCTVLVVDDEPVVRMLAAEVLGEAGHAILEAANGPKALDVLRSDARIDLLVTDVGLPGGLNGRQVADAARVLRPGLKVLFITGYAEKSVIGSGDLEPGMEILTKPFTMDDLTRRIGELLD